jgi:hypothetical protein
VCGEHVAQLIFSTQGLEDTGREEASAKLGQFEPTLRREGRRLQYESVSGQHRRTYLPTCQENGVVPGREASHDSERRVVSGYLPLRSVFYGFLGQRELAEPFQEIQSGGDLMLCPEELACSISYRPLIRIVSRDY